MNGNNGSDLQIATCVPQFQSGVHSMALDPASISASAGSFLLGRAQYAYASFGAMLQYDPFGHSCRAGPKPQYICCPFVLRMASLKS